MQEFKSVEMINLNMIVPNKHQPRKVFQEDALIELTYSIQSYGIIQPISLKKNNDEEYEIIAGERRFRAAQIAGMEEIPSLVIDVDESTSAAIALIENLQREDLNFLEEAESYRNLMDIFKITQVELADKIGKTQSTVANKLRVLKLPEVVKANLVDHSLSERHGRALLKLKDEDLQQNVVNKIIKNNLTVKETEKLIDDIIKKCSDKKVKNKRLIKNFINYRIYVNTIKYAFNEIKKSGVPAEFEQTDFDEYIELKVKIPKNKI